MEKEDSKKGGGPLRPLKIGMNVLLLFILITIGVQNARSVKVQLLWWQGEISLTMLIFICGILGILVALMYKMIKWKSPKNTK